MLVNSCITNKTVVALKLDIHKQQFNLQQIWPFVPKLCTGKIGHLYMTSPHIQKAHLWDTWHSLGPKSKPWQQSHQCQRERQKTSSISFNEKPFRPPFPTSLPSLVCKQSLTSSCTHLTPNTSDEAHSAMGATSRGSRYRETGHHNGLFLLPAFLSCVPHTVYPHAPLSCPLCSFFFWCAVDRSWEYLLSSCCCQLFFLREQEDTWKGGIISDV